MLVSIVERFREEGEREVDRYALWEAAIRELRKDWQAGARPEPHELPGRLEAVPHDQRSEALQDLVAEHLRLAWENGQGTLLESYLTTCAASCPEWALTETIPPDLVEDEFLARYRPPHGDMPGLDDYPKRFPARADVMPALERRFLDSGGLVKLAKRGAGAMGEVWEVVDTRTRERFAMKVPREDAADAGEALRRLAQEAAVTAALEHAGIVHLRERPRSDGGTPFYVMRLVDGETLASRIAGFHRPPPDRTSREQDLCFRGLLESFASTCDAVACAHAGGVLHRDLKPGNVVIEPSGDAAILDWGMAIRIGAAESACREAAPPPEELAGTPESMPPEQADGIADARSDVFALGAILYEILTGGPPHAWPGGARPADWRRIVRLADFPNPRRVNPRTPRALDAICMKALARDPDDRYQSAAGLAGDMRSCLAGDPVTARAESVPLKIWNLLRGKKGPLHRSPS